MNLEDYLAMLQRMAKKDQDRQQAQQKRSFYRPAGSSGYDDLRSPRDS